MENVVSVLLGVAVGSVLGLVMDAIRRRWAADDMEHSMQLELDRRRRERLEERNETAAKHALELVAQIDVRAFFPNFSSYGDQETRKQIASLRSYFGQITDDNARSVLGKACRVLEIVLDHPDHTDAQMFRYQ